MPFHDGFVSDIVGRKAHVNGLPIGKVTDLLVGSPDDTFPKIDGLAIGTKRGHRFAPIESVVDIDDRGSVALNAAPKEPAPPDSQALYLVSDLLDKQIVDVDGRKVVRINDLEVANTGGTLRVIAADIGMGGLLRRLGLRSAGHLVPAIYRRIPRALIAWDSIAPIRDTNPSQVHLSIKATKLGRLHPSELAEIISDLSTRDAATVIHQLDDETAADALEHLDSERQRSIIEDIGTERAADIIEEMDSDDAADLLAELPEDQQSELLAEMNEFTAGELRDLVKYQEHTAGGLMTTDYVWILPHRTAAATIEKLRQIAPETEFIYYLYVTDADGTLVGTLSLRTLLLAAPEAPIEQIMESDLVTVEPDAAAEDVAATIARYDLLACPVVDERGKMLGIVTVDDAIDAIMPPRLAKRLPRFTAHHHRKSPEPAAT
ncbi:MAG: magnesium transporter [Candidatus Eremiobacteraeota bacterium]|nr:magnesium transporter [Candidatus Eremiobacteraeota bacterium]